jgi:hypothetical protein
MQFYYLVPFLEKDRETAATAGRIQEFLALKISDDGKNWVIHTTETCRKTRGRAPWASTSNDSRRQCSQLSWDCIRHQPGRLQPNKRFNCDGNWVEIAVDNTSLVDANRAGPSTIKTLRSDSIPTELVFIILIGPGLVNFQVRFL